MLRRSITRLWVSSRKCNPHHGNHDEAKHAALRPNDPAGKPARSVERRLQQMAGESRSTIRDGIEKRFTPIPSRVKSDGKPQAAGALQSQTREKPDRRCSQQS